MNQVTVSNPTKLPTERPLREIAIEISTDWSAKGKGISPYAEPYLDAMGDLDNLRQMYGADSAREIVLRFLVNARSWTGETAKRIKAELNGMLKADEKIKLS